jgi:adenylate cyclase
MVGYSREMQRSEERTLQKLMKHNELVRASLARHGGREVKTMGDAFLVSFEDGLAAVKAALDIQAGLSAYNQSRAGEDRILIRIGIHTGEILKLDGDVLGNGVNIAARIEPLAEPGGICISSDTYERVRLEIDIKVSSLGRKELKNIADAPEIYRILLEAQGRPAAPA